MSALILILLLAFTLRVQGLTRQPIWDLEGVALERAEQPPAQLLSGRLTAGSQLLDDNAGPLYPLILAGWLAVVTPDAAPARLPALWLSILTVALVFRFGRATLGIAAGLGGALLLALSPYHVWISRGIGSETTLLLATLATGFALWQLVINRVQRRRLSWSALALLALSVPATLLAWPAIPHAGTDVPGTMPAGFAPQHVAALLGVGVARGLTQPWWRYAPALILIAAGVVGNLRRRQPATLFLLAYLIGLSAALWLVYDGRSGDMSYRLAFLLLPPFVVLAAAGWLHPWQRWRGRAVAIGLLLIFLQIGWLYAQFNSPELRTDSIRRLAQDLEALAGAGDAIVVRDAAMALALFRYYDGRAEWDTVPGDGRTMSGGRVWIVRTLDEEDGSAQAGSNSAEAVGPFLGAVRYEGLWQSVELAAYAPEPSIAGIPTEATPAGADWSGELMLAGYRLPEQAQSGGIWQPAFYWRKGAAAAGQYTLFLRLVDAAGRTWSLQEWLLWEDYPPGLWPEDTVMVYQPLLRLPVGLPPGQYEASLQVARTENGQILPLNSGGNEFPLTLRAAIAPATAPDGLAHLPNFQSVNARFGRELRLLGYERAAVESYRPGHTIPIALLWQAENAPSRDYRLRLQLLDAAGRVLQEVVDPLVREDYPTSQWPPGVLLVGRHELLIPAQAAGRQQITAALLPLSDASTLEAEPVDAGGWFSDDIIRLGDVYVEPWPMETTLPDIESPLEAVFGAKGEIMLHGYALSPAGVVPGESLEVTLYWQAGDLIAENWQVFVHLLDGQGNVVAQRDGTPMNGFRPTASWRAGETFADVHTVQFPAALSNGPFTLWVGFYDPATGVRLPVRVAGELQANERLRLQEVESVR